MSKHNAERRERAKSMLTKAGYGDVKELVHHGMAEHEGKTHKSSGKARANFANGGTVSGGAPKKRMDKKGRHKEPQIKINVISAGKDPAPMPAPAGGPPMRPPVPAAAAPGRPMPGASPMPGGMPQRPMGLKTGGAAVPQLSGGAGGAKGRLEKAAFQRRKG